MKTSFEKKIQSLAPYLVLGIAIALCVGLFILFSYLILWGLVLGGVIWLIDFFRRFFFSPKPKKKPETQGRVIEHDEQHK